MPYQSRRQQGNKLHNDKNMITDNSVAVSSNNGGNGNDGNGSIDSASQKKKDREEASKKALKTAAKGAGAYFGGPLGAKAVDAVSNTKAGQKILNKGAKTLNKMPGIGRAADKMNKTGALDAADKGIDAVGGGKGAGGVPSSINKGAVGGEKNVSLPSSHSSSAEDSGSESKPKLAGLPMPSNPSFLGGNDKKKDDDNSDDKSTASGKFAISMLIKIVVLIFLPILLIILFLFVVIAGVTGLFSEYEDAFGISQTTGEETGGLFFEASSKEQQEFYDNINNVKLVYQAMGRTLDPLKVVAVYHVLTTNGADLEYKDMNEMVIMNIADAMFDGNSYNEETFRNNLISEIIPEYLPNSLDGEREQMADDVFDYIERYYNLIGKDTDSSSCASIGSCAYDIKGFHIEGRGDVAKSLQIKDLKVRLMECGSPYGNGTYGKAIDQDLVGFEDYVAGVAYAEVGDGAHMEVLKAQMVAARSFALARPTSMGNALGKKLEEENGQWILQISSCVADQVFCNIDEGCSYMGGGDGQGGIVRSGKVPGAIRTRDPLPENHAIRKAAAETQGEVLVNSRGYVISAGFLASDQNRFATLANQGLNYKQILLQHYNQGNRNYGASDIQQASCNSGGSSANCGVSSGDFAGWKQYEGPWVDVQLGGSGKTIKQIGCLVTSVSMLIAKSGVQTNISDFNPGTFVEFLNSHGGFVSGGNFVWGVATQAAPSFKYQGQISVAGMSREQKLSKIKELTSQQGVYVVAEVKGNTGQHWVAIDSVSGNTVNMMDPGSSSTDMWGQYNWANTSTLAYYKVS